MCQQKQYWVLPLAHVLEVADPFASLCVIRTKMVATVRPFLAKAVCKGPAEWAWLVQKLEMDTIKT